MTEIEDHQRRYYHKGETLEFENVENEWPIFYINMIIDGVFKDIPDQVKTYQALLEQRLVYDFKTGDPLVPQMYQVTNHSLIVICLLYTSPSPRDRTRSRMPSSA